MAKQSKTPRKDTARRASSAGERPKRSGGVTVKGVLGLILPMVSLVIAFVAIVLLFRRIMPPVVEEPVEEPVAAQDPQVAASSSHVEEYTGVDDHWVPEGKFTTGNRELDAEVKAFCDALTVQGSTPRANAQVAYNTIVWSDFRDRTEAEMPSGPDWDKAAAHQFFSSGTPEEGKGGSGDVYEYAAAACYCLRYFGFYDAQTIPVVGYSTTSGDMGSALVFVSDEYGQGCVCDPSLSGDGWMLDRDLYYDVVVANIEQDLSGAEALGLTIQE